MSLAKNTSRIDYSDPAPPEEVHTVEQLIEYLRKDYIKSGTAVVENTDTEVEVEHGLDDEPDLDKISVTPTNDLGNAASFWVAEGDAGKFKIVVNGDPGADTATFVWQIVL